MVSNFLGTPVAEGFVQTQFPPANWAINNPGGGATWFRTSTAGGFGLSSSSTKLDLYSTVAAGSTHELFLPPMSLTAGAAPSMSFDVAYAQYSNETDQLDVRVSDDCGQTWTTVYSKNGAGLSTTSPKTPAFTPQAGEWRTEVVNLSAFTTGDILVKFVGISDYGNNMYIDNVNLSQCTTQSVTASTSKSVICKGEVVTLSAGGASTYVWSNNQTASSFTIAPTSTSTFVVTSDDLNSCKNSASVVLTVNVCAGLASELAIGAVNVYPNPASGSTNLSVELMQNETIEVTVMNNIGQVVYTSKHDLQSGVNSLLVSTQNWANGVYFVKVASEKGAVNTKLTVSK